MTLFLEARPYVEGESAAVVIQGAPYDGGTSYRGGAAAAPGEIRAASDSIESFSPRLGRDLIDIDLADAGDIDFRGLAPEDVMERIACATATRAHTGARVVTFGGDHSISIGTSRGLSEVYPDLVHVVYDAHMDIRDSYDGSEYSHACGTRHMASAGPAWVLGVRSGSRDEYADAAKLLSGFSDDVAIPLHLRTLIRTRPVFVSVDLDVLDPGFLPGTATPEPGGATYKELRNSLMGLAGFNVVAIDFVEVAPPLDLSGTSPVVAAALARECILGLLAP